MTYDDSNQEFLVDLVEPFPLLECNYPCYKCTADKDYCNKCWSTDPLNYLMRYGLSSTCQDSCDDGFTTDGNPDLHCIKCDDSCATCKDDGVKGDAQTCTECAVGYDFKDRSTKKCL